jgi:hypothetical protein
LRLPTADTQQPFFSSASIRRGVALVQYTQFCEEYLKARERYPRAAQAALHAFSSWLRSEAPQIAEMAAKERAEYVRAQRSTASAAAGVNGMEIEQAPNVVAASPELEEERSMLDEWAMADAAELGELPSPDAPEHAIAVAPAELADVEQESVAADSAAARDAVSGADARSARLEHRNARKRARVGSDDSDADENAPQPAKIPVAAASSAVAQQAARGIGTAAASSSEERKEVCVVCLDASRARSVLLLPCRHLCLCALCATAEELSKCPLCKARVADMLPVFV